ncbi:hypothetical protein [Piscirickettsia litoralis]|uniref:Uncharacterized protein n=1 Tax=Piscirickettsia litoralis TaxID=1891921 RepID=A0ABX3A1E3_9GAMM|nr:hypothetical protein [Piscirickettsia litoralis]ODN41225.1 hypothetical protein BGC07_17580 [Piscirickettsia litoralis]
MPNVNEMREKLLHILERKYSYPDILSEDCVSSFTDEQIEILLNAVELGVISNEVEKKVPDNLFITTNELELRKFLSRSLFANLRNDTHLFDKIKTAVDEAKAKAKAGFESNASSIGKTSDGDTDGSYSVELSAVEDPAIKK